MLTSDPYLYLFFFFFLQLVVHLLYFCTLEKPTFLSVRSVTDSPHTDYILSTHWEGGGDPRSLSLFLSVFITLFIFFFLSCCPYFLYFPLCPFPLFPIPFFPALPVCMCMRLIFIAHFALCLHGNTGMRGRSNTGLLESKAQTLHVLLLDQQTCLCTACILRMTLQSVSVPPQ